MTLGQMINLFRRMVRDKADPPMFDDEILAIYANEAEREACRRARLITDSTTATDADDNPVCVYPVAASDATLTLHAKVIFVKRVKLASRDCLLPRVNARDLDLCRPGWESEEGEIQAYSPDYSTGKLRWYQKPESEDTANLTVVRLPLADMAELGDSPEVHARFHERLVDWMIYRAYQEDDTETVNGKLADEALARFEIEFGKPSSALDETYIENEYDFGGFEGVL